MKKKKQEGVRDVDECKEKIEAILREYNCQIGVDRDQDPTEPVLVDLDNQQFEWIGDKEI